MQRGSVAILSPGALGVSFFYHLTGELQRKDEQVFFVGLEHSRSINALLESGLQISDGETIHHLPSEGLIFPTIQAAWDAGKRPEIILACPNPDQLLQVVSTFVALIERLWSEDPEEGERKIPTIILSSNGIYFQRVRQMFVEKLEESILLGRLPDLWPDHMPTIVGHLLRGVTLQTGARQGAGATTIYHPGPNGHSTLAGGAEKVRKRSHELLIQRGGWFDDGAATSPTRLEFEKAMMNLMGNLLGLLYAFNEDGTFRSLALNEILVPEHEKDMRELVHRVFEVGQAVRVFTPQDNDEAVFERLYERGLRIGSHVPSSLQAIEIQINAGSLEAKFPPTETWLIDPLIRYARSAELVEAVEYFEGLRAALIAKMEKAVALAEQKKAPPESQ
ncbi:hypothetical protein IAD21_00424 [Abditibacteriota bacterium]|nr:hypothetical protein IAD21_00424 [Abditibacteriota bacterium]